MNTRHFLRCLLGAAALAVSGLSLAADSAPLPPDSVYRVTAPMQNQRGEAFQLKAMRGHPAIVSMFYNSCEFVCPMLIESMQLTLNALSPEEQAKLSMLLMTFDPARDSVAALKKVETQRQLDPVRWTLARPDAKGARKIAAALDIQYRLLEGGMYNHTTVLVLLDGEGRILGSTRKLGGVDEAFVAQVKSALAQAQ